MLSQRSPLFLAIALLVSTSGLSPLADPVSATPKSGCIMIDEKGRQIDLGKLCGSGQPQPQTIPRTSRSTQTRRPRPHSAQTKPTERGVIFLDRPQDYPLSLRSPGYYVSGAIGNASTSSAQGVTVFYEILTNTGSSGFGVVAQGSKPAEPNTLAPGETGRFVIYASDVEEALPLGFREADRAFLIRITGLTWQPTNGTARLSASPDSHEWAAEFHKNSYR